MSSKISLAGDLGSGKSTVSDILINRLGASYYSTGTKVRAIAERMGMSVVELNKYMESHPEIDTEIDDGLVALSEESGNWVIDSRMAWHFTKGTFKVYLSTDIETSALRIMNAHRRGEHSATLEETIASTRARRLSEQTRYMTQYGVDIKDLSNYSLIVDTTKATPDEVAGVILSSLSIWEQKEDFSCCYISPERLYYPDDAPDMDKLSRYSSALEMGEEMPEITVFEKDGDFHLESGLEVALAYAFAMSTFIPARLVRSEIGDRSFVRMKDSI